MGVYLTKFVIIPEVLLMKKLLAYAAGKLSCGKAKYYAKPYNTQGCNRESEEIMSADECREAINELLQDSILGNSLNGGKRFGRTIKDEQKESSYDNVPSKCSYREVDAQIIFNPNANGRAHTSLAPICNKTQQEKIYKNLVAYQNAYPTVNGVSKHLPVKKIGATQYSKNGAVVLID